MDIQALIQQELQSKELAKAAKAGSEKTSIPLNKITDPSALGSGAIASIMDSGDNESVVDAAKDGVGENIGFVRYEAVRR